MGKPVANCYAVDLILNRPLRKGEVIQKGDICVDPTTREIQPVPEWYWGDKWGPYWAKMYRSRSAGE